jgi:hypothetical protein
MFGTISNGLQKLINDLRKLVLFFTQALNGALRYRQHVDGLVWARYGRLEPINQPR